MTSASSRTKPSTLVVVGRSQAWRVADRAVDVGDNAARPAHDVVVVVADPGFVTGNHAQRLDPAHQTDGGEGVENVVHGLAGDIGKSAADGRQDRLGVSMRMGVDRRQHRDPRTGHAQIGHSQLSRVIRRRRRHDPKYAALIWSESRPELELVKN